MAANTEIIDARVTQVHIDDIRLGRMMVPRQNSQLTVNALDGSIINRITEY